MYHHHEYDTTLGMEELREALALHGIRLPAFRTQLPAALCRAAQR